MYGYMWLGDYWRICIDCCILCGCVWCGCMRRGSCWLTPIVDCVRVVYMVGCVLVDVYYWMCVGGCVLVVVYGWWCVVCCAMLGVHGWLHIV